MNRRLQMAAAVLAAGAVIVGTAGCSMGGDDAPATTTVETQAPAPTTTQAPTTTVAPTGLLPATGSGTTVALVFGAVVLLAGLGLSTARRRT